MERSGWTPPKRFELMPAAAIGCLLALPSRYAATAVFLGSQHVPASVLATPVGRCIRWQLGWGLVELQAASLVVVGVVGVAAWSQGTTAETLHGFRRLLAGETGRLIAVLAIAGAGVRERRPARRISSSSCCRRPAGCWRRPTATPTMRRCPSASGRSPPWSRSPSARCRSPRRLPSPARGRDAAAQVVCSPLRKRRRGWSNRDRRRPRCGRKSETVISQHHVAIRKLYIDALRVEPRSRGSGRLQGVWFA